MQAVSAGDIAAEVAQRVAALSAAYSQVSISEILLSGEVLSARAWAAPAPTLVLPGAAYCQLSDSPACPNMGSTPTNLDAIQWQ